MSALIDYRLDGPHDLVDEAISRIQQYSKLFKFCIRFSGGKDSVATRRLFDMAGVPYEIKFSVTSVDPPELISFIHKYHADVKMERPRINMWDLIVKKGFPPSRVCRYCCSEYKERNTCPQGDRIFTVTGIRWQESRRRARRGMIESCERTKGVVFFHPIIEWSDEQLWDFILLENIPYCSLYDEGFKRIGCVGCPLSSSKNIEREFLRWPGFERKYYKAFELMLESRNFDKWKKASDVMEWYIYGAQKRCEEIENQLDLVTLTRDGFLYSDDYYSQLGVQTEYGVKEAEEILLSDVGFPA